ncbi:MAG: hypothetical protein CME67_07280 [Halobacteriovoraceae bacterium]|nr:hypothetical protein [Halobacteriovoraceae bacterium]|tara:strand:+ start:12356 stop:13330 length:975 start_codon:yes stop_codon:yes gene_type:complete
MKISLLATIIFSMQVLAYRPTVESLFRNGSNGDIGQNSVVANFVLKKKEVQAQDSSEMFKAQPSEFSFKLIFGNEKKAPKLVQASYLGMTITPKKMFEVNYYPVVSESGLRLGDEDLEKSFFYSLMLSLINNQGQMMVKFLKKIGVEIQSNTERVDKEQLYYLGQYMKFLKEATEEEPGKNPLEPESSDAREKIKEVMKRPFLTPSPMVKRVKEGQEFYWEIKTDKVFARFSHDDHKLLELEVKTEQGILSAKCFNYILYGKEMQFPEMLLLKDLKGDEYILNMKKMTNFQDTPENYIKRITTYKDHISENELQRPEVLPSFTL